MTATDLSTSEIGAAMRAARRRFLLDTDGVAEVWLVRHADAYEQPFADDGVFDPGLSPLGRQQAELLARRTAEVRVDAIYTSPARRAMETAAAACRLLKLTPWTFDDLRELRLTAGDGPEEMAAVRRLMRVGDAGPNMLREWPRDGESREAGARRVAAVVDLLVERHPDERVVVFSHGAVINAYLGAVLGLGASLPIYPEYTGVSIVRGRGGERRVLCINDTAHLHLAAAVRR